MAKQYLYESTYLVIMDPTSITAKNVTPYCSQIFDVLEYFKRIHLALFAVKQECEKRLGIGLLNEGIAIEELSEESMQSELERISGGLCSSKKVFSKLLNLIDISLCDKTLDE
jgi:hypothetical protein